MADGFSGMADLIADLRNLPAELKGDVSVEINRAADDMAADITRTYNDHRFTGNLAKGVVKKIESQLKVRILQKAFHIYLFEFGSYKSGERFWKKTPHSTGTMPATPTFIPAAQRHRKRMYERLHDRLKQLKVRGMTGKAA